MTIVDIIKDRLIIVFDKDKHVTHIKIFFSLPQLLSMDLLSRSEVILAKIKEFYRVSLRDSDDRIKFAFHELLRQWSDILIAGNDASDDELFHLNASRGFLNQIFIFALYKDCFTNDHTFTRDTIRICFEFLTDQIEIFTNKNSTTNRIFSVSNIRLIMEILSNLVSHLWYSDTDLFNEQVFLAMREYVDQDLTNDNLTDGILSLLWSVSDNTSLVPILLKTDYAQSLYQWIKNSSTKFREDKQNALINILQNMSRHDDGMEQLNRLDILNIFESMQFDTNLSFSLSMIRVLLTDRNQIKFESIEFINTLVQNTIAAGEDEKYRHDGAHVGELLTVLAKLFYNDEILHMILKTKPSIIELFASLLAKFYPNLNSDHDPLENFTCVLLLNILCCISYHQEYSQKIFDNEQLMSIIQKTVENEANFIDTFMPRTMKSIEQTANEILKNFNEKC
jgi:hypothetical protein